MNKNNERKIIGTMVSVSGVIILSKILGFVKQIVTANAFGATIETDIISIAEGLVLNVDYLLIQALSTAFIPIYISAKLNNISDKKKFVSNVIKVFLLITIALVVVFVAFSSIISKLLAPTYDAELSATLAKYIRIITPAIILLVEMAVFNSLLKANEHFVSGELVSFNQSVILIVLVFTIGAKIGPDTLVVGFYFYAVFNLLYLSIYSRHFWGLFAGNPFADYNVRKLLRMMGPLLLGYSMIFVNQQVDKIIVSGLGAGTVTAMNYAAVLSNFINTFVGSICSILFTYVAQNIAEKQCQKAADLTASSAAQLVTLLLPISALTIVNATDIVTIVFGRGKFDATAVYNCSLALVGYSFTFAPFAIRELFSRYQYAHEDSKTPMINSTISIIANIILSVVLSFRLGVLGVTLATSISVAFCATLNVRSSMRINKEVQLKTYFSLLPRWALGIVACITVSYYGKTLLPENILFFRFIIITVISFIIYGVINYSIIKPLVNKMFKRT